MRLQEHLKQQSLTMITHKENFNLSQHFFMSRITAKLGRFCCVNINREVIIARKKSKKVDLSRNNV